MSIAYLCLPAGFCLNLGQPGLVLPLLRLNKLKVSSDTMHTLPHLFVCTGLAKTWQAQETTFFCHSHSHNSFANGDSFEVTFAKPEVWVLTQEVSEILVKGKTNQEKTPNHKSIGIRFDCPAQTQSCKTLHISQEKQSATTVIKAFSCDVSQSPAGFLLENTAVVTRRRLKVQ